MHRAVAALRALFRSLRRDERGATLAVMAVSLTAVIGLTGIGVETGLWYAVKRQQQSAADFAALSAVREIPTVDNVYFKSSTQPGICGLAKRDAARNGFVFAASFSCPSTSPACTDPAAGKMCANNPPVLGALAGDSDAVEVILSQKQNTVFASLFLPAVTIKTRAVAKVEALPLLACSIATWDNPTNSPGGAAVNFSGTTSVNMQGCGIASNSPGNKSINFQGNSVFTADWFQASGNFNTNGSSLVLDVPTELINAAPLTDPYSCDAPTLGCAGKITWPPIVSPEQTLSATPGTVTPGTYKSSSNTAPMNFTSGNWTLCPGVYVLDGADNQHNAFSATTGAVVQMGTEGVGGCPANGLDGVTMVATSTGNSGGGFTVSSQATVELSAPTTSPADGLPSGLLFAQDPAHAYVNNGSEADSTITADTNTSLQGVLYSPATNVTFTGNSNSSCFLIIANTLIFTGTSTMTANLSSCKAGGIQGPQFLKISLEE